MKRVLYAAGSFTELRQKNSYEAKALQFVNYCFGNQDFRVFAVD